MTEVVKKTKAPPFQKGNKFGKGRPKGSLNMSTTLKKALNTKLTLTDKNGNKKSQYTYEWVIEALIKKAISSRDVSAIREIFDRVDGKTSQVIDVGNKDDIPFKTESSFDAETIKEMARIIANEEGSAN